ncbi:MAG: hypothetical protein HC945_02405 [Nitrosarchaeum sp.]|nr:hypothetical protein [Nitrosarchaeum sp.]
MTVALHPHKRKLSRIDISAIIGLFVILGILRADLVLLAALPASIIYIHATKRKDLLSHLILASLLASIWMIIARDFYSYNKPFLAPLGINLFPLLAWTLGLLGAYVIYSHVEHHFLHWTFIGRLAAYCSIYWPLLIAAETTGYHLLGIRNDLLAKHPGLPFCDCLHAPPWMQTSYFAIGIIYFLAAHFIELKNPHHQRDEQSPQDSPEHHAC